MGTSSKDTIGCGHSRQAPPARWVQRLVFTWERFRSLRLSRDRLGRPRFVHVVSPPPPPPTDPLESRPPVPWWVPERMLQPVPPPREPAILDTPPISMARSFLDQLIPPDPMALQGTDRAPPPQGPIDSPLSDPLTRVTGQIHGRSSAPGSLAARTLCQPVQHPAARVLGSQRWLPIHLTTLARLRVGQFRSFIALPVSDGGLILFFASGEALEVVA